MLLNEYLSVRSIEPRTLENIRELFGLLGNPQQSMACIQVAGTNAKGSTAAMLSSILHCAGYKTGLFTSPALSRASERIRIDGTEIENELFLRCAERVAAAEAKLGRSFGGFDRMTACALLAFKEKGVSFAVLETGLGGRLDTVTAVDTILCMLTSISMDHMQFLGNTLEQITLEKCGIMKQGVPVVSHPQMPAAESIIRSQASSLDCPLRFVNESLITNIESSLSGQSFIYGDHHLKISLLGAHQRINAAAACEAVDVLRRQDFAISDEAIISGLTQAKWPGRLEWVNGVLLDGAHNPDAMRILRKAFMELYPGKRPCVLISLMQDKDIPGILSELALFAADAVAVQITPRALEAEKLSDLLCDSGIPSCSAHNVAEGLEMLKERCQQSGQIPLVAGSLYLVGEARELLLKFQKD